MEDESNKRMAEKEAMIKAEEQKLRKLELEASDKKDQLQRDIADTAEKGAKQA